MEALATFLVVALGIYLLVGLVFALPFVLRGAGRIDPAAARGTLGFRLLLVPGCVALWPVLARKWRDSSAGSST